MLKNNEEKNICCKSNFNCNNYDKPDKKYHFNEAPKIGLQNIGATDYMNVVIQCLCHIPALVNFFKYTIKSNDIALNNKDSLTSSFNLLIENLCPDNINHSKYAVYAPYEFKNKISKMNPLFEGIRANDAKDLLEFIIMTLHEELNKAKKDNSNNNKNLDLRNKNLAFESFAKNFMENNKSIISDLFYGTYCTSTQCGGCSTKLFNYRTYSFIIFPLEEDHNLKIIVISSLLIII